VFANKNMAKSTQKGSKLLVDLMDVIYKSSLAMDERDSKTKKYDGKTTRTFLYYFKTKDKAINDTQNNMVRVVTTLTK
jgi:hypothetical protein